MESNIKIIVTKLWAQKVQVDKLNTQWMHLTQVW